MVNIFFEGFLKVGDFLLWHMFKPEDSAESGLDIPIRSWRPVLVFFLKPTCSLPDQFEQATIIVPKLTSFSLHNRSFKSSHLSTSRRLIARRNALLRKIQKPVFCVYAVSCLKKPCRNRRQIPSFKSYAYADKWNRNTHETFIYPPIMHDKS